MAGTRPVPTGAGRGTGRNTAAAGGQRHIALNLTAARAGEGGLGGGSPRTREGACARPPGNAGAMGWRRHCPWVEVDHGLFLVYLQPEVYESSPPFWDTPSMNRSRIRRRSRTDILSGRMGHSGSPTARVIKSSTRAQTEPEVTNWTVLLVETVSSPCQS